MNQVNIEEMLSRVEKPARYTGGELNAIIKSNAKLKFALCFPDVYEIGMSHLGSRILYHVLNRMEDVACERCFAPWTDMERELRAANLPLFTLESKRPLNECDVIGFSLLYEMCYTNILLMLELAGIPALAHERGEDMPLVICGGPCACNPEPVAAFMDAALIGDGEELTEEVVLTCMKAKEQGLKKSELLLALSKIEGVYIPSFYEPVNDENGRFLGIKRIEECAPLRVRRRVVRDLDRAAYVGEPIVPFLNIVHDRVAIELFRGCTRGCRFCQAGFIYRPVRERSEETLMRQARELVSCTGYDEVSLFSLSSGDYSDIHRLVLDISNELGEQKVSISLPSLRIDAFLKEDLERMQSVRKSGLTFAPEAGTQRLRDVINKGVTEEDLLRSVSEAFAAGWSAVKLYFMIGLPTETQEDLDGIADLAKKVCAAYYAVPKDKRAKGLRVSVSASSFVPKPFTPFQWEPQSTKAELVEKQRYLRALFKGIRGAELNYHAPDLSMLEAVFARGDRELSRVLQSAYQKGCRFDSWDEHFSKNAWDEAFAECGVDPAAYAHRRRELDEPLPYDHIDMLVTKEYLKIEHARALNAAKTKDCRNGCNGCFGDLYADYCKV